MPRDRLPCVYHAVLNNPPVVDPDVIGRRFSGGNAVGIVYQLESGEEKATLHFDITIYFNRYRDGNACQNYLKKLFAKAPAHQAIRRCMTFQHAHNCWNYSAKASTRVAGPWSMGSDFPHSVTHYEAPKAVERQDLKSFKDDAPKLSLSELEMKYPNVEARYPKFFSKYAAHPSQKPPVIILISGPPGVGKTSSAVRNYPGAHVCHDWPDWFEPYNGDENAVIIDNFKMSRIWQSFDKFLGYIDRYPCTLPVKGAHVPRNCRAIVITTSEDPERWLRKAPVKHAEFWRRIDKWYQYRQIFLDDDNPDPAQSIGRYRLRPNPVITQLPPVAELDLPPLATIDK